MTAYASEVLSEMVETALLLEVLLLFFFDSDKTHLELKDRHTNSMVYQAILRLKLVNLLISVPVGWFLFTGTVPVG